MSTNSRIGIKVAENAIVSVYHHWDGYPEWLGKVLTEQYNNIESVTELIDGGDMSSCWSDNVYDYEKLNTSISVTTVVQNMHMFLITENGSVMLLMITMATKGL